MGVHRIALVERIDDGLEDEVCPVYVHAKQHECHQEQVHVRIVDHVPLVVHARLVDIDVGQETEREDNNAHVYPHEQCDHY